VNGSINGATPTKTLYAGTVFLTASATPPPGTAFAAGQWVGNASYPDLFAAIGTQYNDSGSGSSFKLPDLTTKAPGGMRYVIVYADFVVPPPLP
jgi:microcystin-dependent protein